MPPPVLIAGAGIAGLTLALALANRGIACRVLERSETISEAGAGIQIGPNAMQVLRRIGVADLLEPAAGKPEAIVVSNGATGRVLARMPLAGFMEQRHGAPYWVAHRADLQAALLTRVRQCPEIEIATGFEVASWTDLEASAPHGSIGVQSATGTHAYGRCLVGADGIWATTRRRLFPQSPIVYAGKMAARTIIPMPLAEGRFAIPHTGIWLGRDAHVVHYPIRGHREIALIAIVDAAELNSGKLGESWGGKITSPDVLRRLHRFTPELLSFVSKGAEWRMWSLYDTPPLPAWSRGDIVLIGDAAHPILPFLAQGGAMAIEDAETLAAALDLWPGDNRKAFAAFEAARRARVLRVQASTQRNGSLYHMSGLTGIARDFGMSLMPGRQLMQSYDWLYGWNGDRFL